jgi:hypothetical protein
VTPDEFPAKASPTECTPRFSETGFSREEAGVSDLNLQCAARRIPG